MGSGLTNNGDVNLTSGMLTMGSGTAIRGSGSINIEGGMLDISAMGNDAISNIANTVSFTEDTETSRYSGAVQAVSGQIFETALGNYDATATNYGLEQAPGSYKSTDFGNIISGKSGADLVLADDYYNAAYIGGVKTLIQNTGLSMLGTLVDETEEIKSLVDASVISSNANLSAAQGAQ